MEEISGRSERRAVEDQDPKIQIARLFFDIAKTFKRSIRRHFEDIGLTMPQSLVMGTLNKSGEMKLTDLSREINLSNSTLSGIIDRLEKQGLATRTRSREDRRIVYVKATSKYQELHSDIFNKAEKSFQSLLGTGSPEELEKIIEGLKTLRKVLRNIE